MTSPIVIFPRKPIAVMAESEWRSLGELTGLVLSDAASRSSVSASASTIGPEENGQRLAASPCRRPTDTRRGSPALPRDRQAL